MGALAVEPKDALGALTARAKSSRAVGANLVHIAWTQEAIKALHRRGALEAVLAPAVTTIAHFERAVALADAERRRRDADSCLGPLAATCVRFGAQALLMLAHVRLSRLEATDVILGLVRRARALLRAHSEDLHGTCETSSRAELLGRCDAIETRLRGPPRTAAARERALKAHRREIARASAAGDALSQGWATLELLNLDPLAVKLANCAATRDALRAILGELTADARTGRVDHQLIANCHGELAWLALALGDRNRATQHLESAARAVEASGLATEVRRARLCLANALEHCVQPADGARARELRAAVLGDDSGTSEPRSCVICLEPFTSSDAGLASLAVCEHTFHRECLALVLHEPDGPCPTCRTTEGADLARLLLLGDGGATSSSAGDGAYDSAVPPEVRPRGALDYSRFDDIGASDSDPD